MVGSTPPAPAGSTAVVAAPARASGGSAAATATTRAAVAVATRGVGRGRSGEPLVDGRASSTSRCTPRAAARGSCGTGAGEAGRASTATIRPPRGVTRAVVSASSVVERAEASETSPRAAAPGLAISPDGCARRRAGGRQRSATRWSELAPDSTTNGASTAARGVETTSPESGTEAAGTTAGGDVSRPGPGAAAVAAGPGAGPGAGGGSGVAATGGAGAGEGAGDGAGAGVGLGPGAAGRAGSSPIGST